MSRLHRLPSAFWLLISGVCLMAQPDAPHRLATRALGETPLLTDLRELCDTIGGRPTGSSACDRAVEWAARKFRNIGIQNVSVEPFTGQSLWLPGSAAAAMSPSTKGPLEARLLDVGEAKPEDFAKLGAAIKGAIVLVHSAEMKTF